jgi:outer membrane protein OmpA-like peptidoglycan-associated protein
MVNARLSPVVIAALVLGLAGSAATATQTCLDVASAIASAAKSGDAGHARELYLAAEAGGECSGEPLFLMGRNTAYAHYHRAYADEVSGPAREQMLREALSFGRPWQVLAAVADLEWAAKRYAEATLLLQEALDDIREESLNPIAPPVDVIASIQKRAEETRLLAPHYVKRVDRSGNPGGLAQRTFRGFVVRKVAVPVHFEFNKAEFTAEGRRAVTDMFDYLTADGSPDIELIGHTDPRGTVAYNQSLSERRAAAVKAFLLTAGYDGRIVTTGRGELEPFQADDPGAYAQEEIWQLDRRVELER